MHAWEQIQKTLNYIEDHLSEDIDTQELANLAHLSPFYYQRLFKRLVKKPVAEYIKLRRMAVACDLLLEDTRILDVATALNFSSHEQFSRTFKQTFGLTPNDYRKAPRLLGRTNKPELLLNYTMVDENVPLITDGIVLEVSRMTLNEALTYQGFKTDAPLQFIDDKGVEPGENPLLKGWEELHEKKANFKHLFDESEIGVTYASDAAGHCSYFAGARVSRLEEGFDSWILSTGDYIRCTFEAENFESLVMDVLYKAHTYLFSVWLPKKGIETEPFAIEYYPQHLPETAEMQIWVKIKNDLARKERFE